MNRYWLDGADLPNLKQPPVSSLVDFQTPANLVFSLYHMRVPLIDRRDWKITIKGLVAREATLSLDELRAMPQRDVNSFHECCGHPFYPTVPVRRVANVVWRGVPLKDVLARAGVTPDAKFVWSTGADGGDYHGINVDAFVKDLPIAEVDRDDVMLALQMNGEDLEDGRGGPVRLVVPGYYGTNSTKWLVSLELQAERSPGYFTTVMYNDREIKDGNEIIAPLWRVAPHSIIVAPAHQRTLQLRQQTVISGWAWGADPIETVDVSVDGGLNWRRAELALRYQHSWQGFGFPWTPTTSGAHQLQCRAFDAAGRGQPPAGARNSIFAIDVSVEDL